MIHPRKTHDMLKQEDGEKLVLTHNGIPYLLLHIHMFHLNSIKRYIDFFSNLLEKLIWLKVIKSRVHFSCYQNLPSNGLKGLCAALDAFAAEAYDDTAKAETSNILSN